MTVQVEIGHGKILGRLSSKHSALESEVSGAIIEKDLNAARGGDCQVGLPIVIEVGGSHLGNYGNRGRTADARERNICEEPKTSVPIAMQQLKVSRTCERHNQVRNAISVKVGNSHRNWRRSAAT